jgi:hypothetical protein
MIPATLPLKWSLVGRLIDAGAAGGLALSMFTTAVQLRVASGTVSETLGPFAAVWAVGLLAASLLACIGSLLRKAGHSLRAQVALGAEYVGWLAVSVCALVFMGAVVIQFGSSALITIGFVGALGLLTFGRWWALNAAMVAARKVDRES